MKTKDLVEVFERNIREATGKKTFKDALTATKPTRKKWLTEAYGGKVRDIMSKENQRVRFSESTSGEKVRGVSWKSKEGMWTKVGSTVDSGAVNTVGPDEIAPKIPTEEGEAKRRGVKYRVANGTIIPNEGEKKLRGYGEDYTGMGLNVQIADVTKPLLSVREMVQAGQRVVFDSTGSYAENKFTGKRQYFKDKQGSYVLELWMYDTEEDENTCGCNSCHSESRNISEPADAGFVGQELRSL